jgi:REP element-mobilizing transposase RayT
LQSITFRLNDALPADVLSQLKEELKDCTEEERRARLDPYFDAGYGSCTLRDPCIARLVENALQYFDSERYRLITWVIMPNHVHVFIEQFPNHPLADVIDSWKSFTARKANKILNQSGRFWYPDYFDRYVRDIQHFDAVVYYIHQNPVKAGLVEEAEDWPFSSAKHQEE